HFFAFFCLSTTNPIPSSMEKTLVPAPAAQFPGSFAAVLRQDHRKYAEIRTFRSIFHTYFLDGWDDISLWKSAFVEFMGSTSLCYTSAMIDSTLKSFDTPQVAAYVAVSNIFLLTLFIYALAPASGGHINPIITFATVCAGLTGFSRGVLYMVAQTIGAALAGGLIRGSLGLNLTRANAGGGCLLDSSIIPVGQAYLIESVLSFVLLLLSFGVGLDPRQGKVFGPKLGPFLTACSLGLVSFSSVGLAPGYPGAGLNPARCFSFAVARGTFQNQWIWWFGPVSGALVHSVVYHIVPPYHLERRKENLAQG
ncbi:Aquaporin-4, partial [Lachnellula suecica]